MKVMINIVFEGSTGTGKTTLIKCLIEHFKNSGIKVGYTIDLDKESPLYDVINKMYQISPLIISKDNFNTTKYETLIQAADYLYNRERIYSQNNDINFFDRNFASVYSYQYELMKKFCPNHADEFMSNVLNCMKCGEKKIDLMVYFLKNVDKSIARSEKRDGVVFSQEERKIFKNFDLKLTDFIRYNNSEYNLLIIDDNDTIESAKEKVIAKVEEIIEDKKIDEADKWYNLYKYDVDEFKTADDYIKYKLGYKKKFINKIKKYSNYGGKIAELGCGTGLLAGYMQKNGYSVTAIDISQKMLNYAQDIAKTSKVISCCDCYKREDILKLKFKRKYFDVVFSNGVMEHFNDNDIITSIRKQLKVAKYSIVGVPSLYFNMNEKMLGNERSLSIKEWDRLFKLAGAEIVEIDSFNYYSFWKRLIEVKKWFKPKAFLLFVLKEKE